MKFLKRLLALPLIAVVLLGQGCTKGTSPEAQKLSQRAVLNVWAVTDDEDAYQTAITAFRKDHPFVEVKFKRYRLEEYESAMLNALAEDQGPDVFLIHNTWVDKYLSKIQPEPKTANSAFQVSTSGNGNVAYEVRTIPLTSVRTIRNDFADVVGKDAIRKVNVAAAGKDPVLEERVVGIPQSVDTLALYYNKDLLNASGIATPPDTWDQFQAQVKRVTRYASDGSIARAGAGIGLGSNVERSPDIISLLMMQNGTEMTDEDGDPTFTRTPQALQEAKTQAPGVEALQFYSAFATPSKDAYTWNVSQPNSLNAFIQGTSGFFLGYSYHLPLIKARAPKLNLGISRAPQISGNAEINFANYWMWTVSKKSKNADLAWIFVDALTQKEGAKNFLDVAKHPAARKALLEAQLEDEDVGVFAAQVLTAKSWYHGMDPRAADVALIELLDAAPQAEDTNQLHAILEVAQEKVAQTLR
jgi:ABC-type glycerol-3-phosphate transport system substrate-binding protein